MSEPTSSSRQPDVGRFGDATGEFLVAYSQSLSRRRLLARLGHLALGVLGISIVSDLLPVDRAEASHTCGDGRNCGLYGRPCAACNGGKPPNQCPSGVTQGSWTVCCEDCSDNKLVYITYADCCNCTTADRQRCVNDAPFCKNCRSRPLYCVTGTYCCTVTIRGASCSSRCAEPSGTRCLSSLDCPACGGQ